MKKDTRGSGIIWAIAVVMILSVIIAGALTFAYYNYHATIHNTTKVQLELDAKSCLVSVVSAIESGKYTSDMIPNTLQEQKSFSLTVPLSSVVKEGYIKKTKKTEIVVVLTLQKGNQETTVKAYLDFVERKWQLNHYDVGGVTS